MPKKNWLKNFRLNIHAPGTGFALIILALTQVPVGIKNVAEDICKRKHQYINNLSSLDGWKNSD